MGNIFQVVCQT